MDAQGGDGLKQIIFGMGPIIIIVVMIFLLFRSQQKETKKRVEMLGKIKTGDKIVTAGGIHGLVTNVKENTFIVKIADNVKIEVNKAGVSSVAESSKDEKVSK